MNITEGDHQLALDWAASVFGINEDAYWWKINEILVRKYREIIEKL